MTDSESKPRPPLLKRVFTRRNILQGAGLCVGVIAIQAWQGRNSASGAAPPIPVHALDGTALSLRQPHLVHFWATWCGVCSAMAHNIERLDGQPVLRVAARSGSDAELKAWLVANGESEAGVINDPLGAVAAAWGVNAYPTTFAVASDGEIVSSTVGYATELGLRARLWLAG